MPTVTEFILIALIIIVVFGLHKLPAISRGVGRLRLKLDKSIAEEAIEVATEKRDHIEGKKTDNEPEQQRGTT